ncbi:MAG: hypothetical protein IJ830_02505 [Alphaproteobacteria bacterium]|nr:hypothetical protein [Alphaproteobacteria bacterium]
MANDVRLPKFKGFNRTASIANLRAKAEALRVERMVAEQNVNTNVNTAPEKTVSRESA